MAIVVARVDDRLVHGQVVIGWGRPLEIGRIALVDDEVAASDFEQDLYRMAVPAGIAIEFLAVAAAGPRLAELAGTEERVLLLAGSVATMAALHRALPKVVVAINLGGIHDGPNRREYLRYVYLTEAEVAALRDLAQAGVMVSAQDLPTAAPVRLEALVG